MFGKQGYNIRQSQGGYRKQGKQHMTTSGGGAKKVLYTLATARRIGLLNSAKALGSKNTCKACGLGMGGQRGGMTNELDEFPSVCNKSVQAQSTDIQSPIPSEVFRHSIAELSELSGHELEHLGRLGTPLLKAAGASHFMALDWGEAIKRAVQAFAKTEPSRSFFYSSGRSSNEAGFLLQLLARVYGTNNVSNCSFYCHQATSEALDATIGTGTATVELDDLAGCDLFFLIGANPASNHPRLLHKLIELRRRGGTVIVIDCARPIAAISSLSVPPRLPRPPPPYSAASVFSRSIQRPARETPMHSVRSTGVKLQITTTGGASAAWRSQA